MSNAANLNTANLKVLYFPESAELRFLPEGPYPCGVGQFSWVAIQHGADRTDGSLNIFDLATKTNKNFPLKGRPGFAFPTTKAGTFVLGMDHALELYDTQTNQYTLLADGIDKGVSGTIVNDGVAFDGGIVFGCKDVKFAENKAGLYLWRSRDRKLIKLRDDQVCSNGKIVYGSGNEVTLLDIDTPTKTVVRYTLDVAHGKLSPPQVMIDLRDRSDFPDGMIATPDGKSVVISMYNPLDIEAGQTCQFSLTDGSVEFVWKTPQAPQATCPQFIDFEGKVHLVVTTAVEHMSADRFAKYPISGALFMGETKFKSCPPTPAVAIG